VVCLRNTSTPAATTAAAAGIPSWLIKVLGRWSSDCYERYGPKAGYIVQQGAAGVPVQADSSVITIHTSPPRAQGEMQPTCYPPQQLTAVTGYTPQQVQFSQAGHSGAMVSGYPPQPFQPQFVQAGQSGAMVSRYPSQPFQPQFVQAGQSGATFTGYPPQQI